MDIITKRLVLLGIDPEDAEALVEIGISTPRAIKAATQSDLAKARGIGNAKAKQIKDRFKIT